MNELPLDAFGYLVTDVAKCCQLFLPGSLNRGGIIA